jgi:hypothetical protein
MKKKKLKLESGMNGSILAVDSIDLVVSPAPMGALYLLTIRLSIRRNEMLFIIMQETTSFT